MKGAETSGILLLPRDGHLTTVPVIERLAFLAVGDRVGQWHPQDWVATMSQ